jgi:hypothetical protein
MSPTLIVPAGSCGHPWLGRYEFPPKRRVGLARREAVVVVDVVSAPTRDGCPGWSHRRERDCRRREPHHHEWQRPRHASELVASGCEEVLKLRHRRLLMHSPDTAAHPLGNGGPRTMVPSRGRGRTNAPGRYHAAHRVASLAKRETGVKKVVFTPGSVAAVSAVPTRVQAKGASIIYSDGRGQRRGSCGTTALNSARRPETVTFSSQRASPGTLQSATIATYPGVLRFGVQIPLGRRVKT